MEILYTEEFEIQKVSIRTNRWVKWDYKIQNHYVKTNLIPVF